MPLTAFYIEYIHRKGCEEDQFLFNLRLVQRSVLKPRSVFQLSAICAEREAVEASAFTVHCISLHRSIALSRFAC